MTKTEFFTLILFALVASSAARGQVAETAPVEKTPIAPTKTESDSRPLNKVVVDYEYDSFNEGYGPWRQGYVSVGHRFDFGSVIGRYNHARRFDIDGDQYEVDVYPHLRDGTYAYLNYGHSDSAIFPQNRFGAEIFQSLGGGFEASLGFRRLDFRGGPVNLFTGSVAMYFGNYYIYLRPYHTPSDIGASDSLTLGARYYLDDEQYLAAAAGGGLSVQQDPSLNVVGLHSQKASAEAYLRVAKNVFIHPSFACEVDEVRAGSYRDEQAYDMSIEIRF